MNDDVKPALGDGVAVSRPTYERPRLVLLGNMNDLVAGGVTQDSDDGGLDCSGAGTCNCSSTPPSC